MMSALGAIPVYKMLPPVPGATTGAHHSVVIVGGGLVGLTAALDLGRKGHEVVLISRHGFIPHGSKAICFSKRTLDIWNELGIAARIVGEGVEWNVGKVFRGASENPVYTFDMLPIKDQEMPGFINLPQYRAEEILIEALMRYPNVQLRWGHELTALHTASGELAVREGQQSYSMTAEWILACDGARSPVRTMLGLEFNGQAFEDSFLIADVKFSAARPAERCFWFDPPWEGASALMHRQPGGIWRLDFQLGVGVDREAAISRENVEQLIRGMIGEDTLFEGVWYSLYSFQCRRMDRFVHGRTIFLGDSAHIVSPFGARGANGGIADANNLCWKLDAVIRSKADIDLIETYNTEAVEAADINILNSTRSTDFIAPRTRLSRIYRNAVLDLAEQHTFARPFVNSGRLHTPPSFIGSPLTIADRDLWTGGVPAGSPAIDAPLKSGWLLQRLHGEWSLLATVPIEGAPFPVIVADTEIASARYDLSGSAAYLIRPDQYVAGRWKNFCVENLETVKWRN